MGGCKLNILGSGSALPKATAFPTAQILEMRGHEMMIDCGEGAQIRMREYGTKYSRLNHIFISHLHGDHCFGLPGMISSMAMLGRTADVTIHAFAQLEKLMTPILDFCLSDFPFKVIFQPFEPDSTGVIFEDRAVRVRTIPLRHRVPCSGFLFEERTGERHLNRKIADAYGVPMWKYNEIKAGADFVTDDGELVPNSRLTTDPTPPKRFAYMSDTVYSEKYIDMVRGVDCLYHESTFLDADGAKIVARQHSSASQAATFALKAEVKKLVIGHYSARYNNPKLFLDEAHPIFKNTFAAQDGCVIEF